MTLSQRTPRHRIPDDVPNQCVTEFDLNVLPDRERVIVAPAGEIDLSTAPRVQETIEELLERGFAQIIVDLRQVQFLDSQGIRALLIVNGRAQELGAEISLRLGDTMIRRPLEICGVLDRLTVIT